ncbi:MAG: hypothetical protein ACK56I_16625, partial [bacterium]
QEDLLGYLPSRQRLSRRAVAGRGFEAQVDERHQDGLLVGRGVAPLIEEAQDALRDVYGRYVYAGHAA